ncbi:hypothetical protein [Nitrobacter sp.]|uniref:hypothetical protein n=1 Tax=Nitrobacter sp. TaxID=29420 RepID=UPI0029CABF51|nr:hypothetical protein [Nitrobacter sp.]
MRAAEVSIVRELGLNDGGWPTDALFRLRKSLEIALHCGEASTTQWHLLYVIFESLRSSKRCRPFSDGAEWEKALHQAVEAVNAHWFRHTLIGSSREQVVADAIMTLRRKGFNVRIDSDGARLTPSDFQRLCKRLEKKIKHVGGLHVADALLDLMRRVGRVNDESLIHARTPQMLMRRRAEAGTPWHYIYSLAVKHFNRPNKEGNKSSILQSMEEYARLLAAVIDVEPHSSYENMHIARGALHEALGDTLIYDEMFSFPQWQPLAARHLVPLWFSALEAEGCVFPVLTAGHWAAFSDRLLSISQPSALTPIEANQFMSEPVGWTQGRTLIDACCPSTGGVNERYSDPMQTAARTATYYPILPAGHGRRLIQPRGVTARALCERVYTLMRKADVPDLENRMGRALERLTADVMRRGGHTITAENAKYPNPSGSSDLEIDLAVETNERIFLFECKKKPLTNAARRGETFAALKDLEASFLRSIQQLAQHEAVLRSQGQINFRNGSRIALNGRSVEKFCISLFDHGSLQHRDMTMAMLEVFINSEIQFHGKDALELQRAINRRLNSISKNVKIIVDSQGGHPERMFSFAMSSWWLSIDQLEYAIIKGGSLWSGIQRVRHLTYHSGDFIYDVLATSKLNEAGEAMFEMNKKMDNRSLL